ncbi:uncharacterized protein F5Z01DRAFT_673352 [Emericellopsis atlantica]|uniref:Ubiquitin-like protease family profile domain-containing protein n=1 Tax=Emericellopsis atlantica TaxID=2614577 RepID=A0A9P7ZPF7_9HYPO|nr:uncharacterized protein F5Z01DRAFT_673352 [Emericellopsis atlantica]KAG9255407.1 hypothetical protein F5Z01DRAFT_673352 [Emericellopsis atlantica]
MGKGNLSAVKGLGSRAVDNISVQVRGAVNLVTRQSKEQVRPAKRQKQCPEYSQHFPQNKPRDLPKRGRDDDNSAEVWEFTIEEPRNDSYGKKNHARASSGPRPKKPRLLHVTGPAHGKATKPEVIHSDDEPISIADSQDHVIVDDLADNDGPPPANIQSDVLRGRPRKSERVPPMQGPFVKKPKRTSQGAANADVSEDELARTPSKGKARATNFSALQQRKRQRSPSKADIQPTKFTSTEASPDPLEVSACWLEAAACGRNSFRAGGQKSALVEDDHHNWKLKILGEDGKWKLSTIEWLSVSADSIVHIYHNATHSKHVRISRMSRLEMNRTLHLQFTSKEIAVKFLKSVDSELLCSQGSAQLQATFERAMSEALNYQEKNGTKDDSSTEESLPLGAAKVSPQPQGKPAKLKDKMTGPPETANARATKTTSAVSPTQPTTLVTKGPSTRRTQRLAPDEQKPLNNLENFETWTSLHPDWRSRWPQPLIYPATGKNRATVDQDDILRLDEGEFLNDNLISFYLRHLQLQLEKERPELLNKVHILSSFFHEKLKKDRYAGVQSWTAKIDIFSYDYVIVPVNENMHWYMAIICNPGNALRESTTAAKESSTSAGDQTERGQITEPEPKHDKSKEPKIVTMDSLAIARPSTCKILREYLVQEAQARKSVAFTTPIHGMTAKKLPEQQNYCDCGVYILSYVEQFLKDPDEACRRLLNREGLEWEVEASEIRSNMRDMLFSLQAEQQQRLQNEKEEKLKRKKQLKTLAKSSEATGPPDSNERQSSLPSEESGTQPTSARDSTASAPVSCGSPSRQAPRRSATTQASRDTTSTTPATISRPKRLPLVKTDGPAAGLMNSIQDECASVDQPDEKCFSAEEGSPTRSPMYGDTRTVPAFVQLLPESDGEEVGTSSKGVSNKRTLVGRDRGDSSPTNQATSRQKQAAGRIVHSIDDD